VLGFSIKVFIAFVLFITALLLFPASSVVGRTNAPAISAEDDHPPLRPSRLVLAEISAYTSSPDETDSTPDVTAWGTTPENGTLACPSKYPFGTWVRINGKKYQCEDRMHARYRDKEVFDMWMASKSEAFKWGRRTLTVEILS